MPKHPLSALSFALAMSLLVPLARDTHAAPAAELVKDSHVSLKQGDREAVRYHIAPNAGPKGTDSLFTRSGYLHPVATPSGLSVTNDFAPKHLHHHGVWTAWTHTTYAGKPTDFWNSKKAEGRVEFLKLEAHGSDAQGAFLHAVHRHLALKAGPQPVEVLREAWHVRLLPDTTATVIDLTFTHTCSTDKPLELLKYHYGGLGLRGSAHWEGKTGCTYLTSEGKTRTNGNGTAARWCALSGQVEGKPATLAILCHPSNFRSPQKVRIHPDEPFFCYAPEQDGPFTLTPEKPYTSRYRLIASDGEPDPAALEKHWNAYAKTPAQ